MRLRPTSPDLEGAVRHSPDTESVETQGYPLGRRAFQRESHAITFPDIDGPPHRIPGSGLHPETGTLDIDDQCRPTPRHRRRPRPRHPHPERVPRAPRRYPIQAAPERGIGEPYQYSQDREYHGQLEQCSSG